jgi:hypothetical protein
MWNIKLFTLATFAAISSAIFSFWWMWTSKSVTNVQVRKRAPSTSVIIPLIHIYQKEKIALKIASVNTMLPEIQRAWLGKNYQNSFSEDLTCCWIYNGRQGFWALEQAAWIWNQVWFPYILNWTFTWHKIDLTWLQTAAFPVEQKWK